MELDKVDLVIKVKDVYKMVAQHPEGKYHFKMGRELAEELGYSPEELDQIPAASIDSFAGVGCPFAVVEVKPGQ